MALSLQESFDRSCRLCAEEQDVTIMIFSAEAEAMLLQNKLNKYLLIEVDETDRLPKNICLKCCSKLQTVCEFIDTARTAQDLLHDRSILLDQVSTKFTPIPIFNNHIKNEPMNFADEDENYTEMEVSVDPMMILENYEAGDENHIDDNDTNEPKIDFDDVSYLHGLDGENVTIKLIRRGDQESGPLELLEEVKKDNKDKPFPCLMCQRSFCTELALKNHMWTHSCEEKKPTKQFKCHTCDDEFEFRVDLMSHLKEHKISSTCQECGRSFRSKQNLALHMESHRSPQNAHVCNVCGRAYNTLSNLKTHSVTHSSERPFSCHLCKKSFKRNQDLKFHINQHTGAKPYNCPFCDKSFASSGNCYSHRSRMHPDRRLESKRARAVRRRPDMGHLPVVAARPPQQVLIKGVYKYQCLVCRHNFVKRDNFTYHMFQHTGEKPFHCTLCTEKFVTRRGLLIHYEKAHKGRDRPLALISKNALLK